ncbi:TetR/AcrR family transcriptional regulator C-terminal domain-containing protein [Dactylosporangium sp. CA-139066]|uniref:TetR/AcrR family transcriptional regulator C-terminal domain-containing protein n=1 Tax=Dactylosporangium sp. CA-139066 TaxID=3239930 RepID=UPI003D92A78C
MVDDVGRHVLPPVTDPPLAHGLKEVGHDLLVRVHWIVRPAVTPATLDAVEAGLRMLRAGGFPLGMAVDALNSLTLFVLGHAAAEVGIGTSSSGPGSPDWLASLDADRYPLLLESVRSGAGVDDAARFTFAVESLLDGFAAQLVRGS